MLFVVAYELDASGARTSIQVNMAQDGAGPGGEPLKVSAGTGARCVLHVSRTDFETLDLADLTAAQSRCF